MNKRFYTQVAKDILATILFSIGIIFYTKHGLQFIVDLFSPKLVGEFVAALPYIILYTTFIWFLNLPLPDPNTFEDPDLVRYQHQSLPYILVILLIVIFICIFLLEHTTKIYTLVIAFFALAKDLFSHLIDAYHFRSDNKKSFASVKNHEAKNDSTNEVLPASNVPPTTETAIPSSGKITITIETCNYPIHIIVSQKKV